MSLLEPVFNLQVQATDCVSPNTLHIPFLLLPVTIHPWACCPKMQSYSMTRWNVWYGINCCVTQTPEI